MKPNTKIEVAVRTQTSYKTFSPFFKIFQTIRFQIVLWESFIFATSRIQCKKNLVKVNFATCISIKSNVRNLSMIATGKLFFSSAIKITVITLASKSLKNERNVIRLSWLDTLLRWQIRENRGVQEERDDAPLSKGKFFRSFVNNGWTSDPGRTVIRYERERERERERLHGQVFLNRLLT